MMFDAYIRVDRDSDLHIMLEDCLEFNEERAQRELVEGSISCMNAVNRWRRRFHHRAMSQTEARRMMDEAVPSGFGGTIWQQAKYDVLNKGWAYIEVIESCVLAFNKGADHVYIDDMTMRRMHEMMIKKGERQ